MKIIAVLKEDDDEREATETAASLSTMCVAGIAWQYAGAYLECG